MPEAPPGRLLDLTRTVSRLGTGPMTGIDRVEVAWLSRLLIRPEPLWGILRTPAGYLLLDRAGCAEVRRLADAGSVPGRVDWLGRLLRPRHPVLARAEAVLRRCALARSWRPGLRRLLQRLPPGTSYLNLGHANLTAGMISAARAAGLRSAVLLHDTIPLDHPELCRPGTPAKFRAMVAAASMAEVVIHSAEATRRATERHLLAAGRVPEAIVAPLGVPMPPVAEARFARPEEPYFLALGTIEPRKNLALLLDVWDRLPARDRPLLLVVGRRGWAEPALFARLERTAGVRECAGVGDEGVAHLLAGARALLFPSLAEGFGLPVFEAAACGTPVACLPHPVFTELLGRLPVYLSATDSYAWSETVMRLTRAPERRPAATVPGWEDHFKLVLTRV